MGAGGFVPLPDLLSRLVDPQAILEDFRTLQIEVDVIRVRLQAEHWYSADELNRRSTSVGGCKGFLTLDQGPADNIHYRKRLVEEEWDAAILLENEGDFDGYLYQWTVIILDCKGTFDRRIGYGYFQGEEFEEIPRQKKRLLLE